MTRGTASLETTAISAVSGKRFHLIRFSAGTKPTTGADAGLRVREAFDRDRETPVAHARCERPLS